MAYKATFFNFDRWGDGKDVMMGSSALRDAGVSTSFMEGTLSVAAAVDADIIGVFMDSKVDAAAIAALPNLKFLTTISTGFDHVDLAAAAARNISVSSVPAYGENTVAEFAFALILALSRKLCEARVRVRDEKKFTTDGLAGFDLAGKTLGVIGTGRIGKHAIRIGKGFDMRVVACDVTPDIAFASEAGYSYVSLEELLAQSDVITVHAPSLPSTHHLIHSGNIDRMKQGAYLVNTARGAIVETAAVIAALKSGRLGGAGLDVIEEEAQMKTGNMSELQELLKMPNVIITPHNAFNTREAFLRIVDTTIDNIVAFAKGSPINVVKPQ